MAAAAASAASAAGARGAAARGRPVGCAARGRRPAARARHARPPPPRVAATQSEAAADAQAVQPPRHRGEYDFELEVAAQAVRVASHLCQRVQARLLNKVDGYGEQGKDDGSEVTVADYSAQACISYILQEAFPDTKLSLIGEEDSADLANQPETLAAVVTTVNEALNSPSARVGPLEHIGGVTLTPQQVCDAIDAGGSLGGKKGRHWILDPVDGTYGFVQGDQYAVALAMIDDGELVVGALGCPNLPTRTEFLAYAHRYHRLLKRLFPPPDDSLWDKGCMFLAQRGCGCTVEPVGDSEVVAQRIAPVPVNMTKREPENATFCEPVRKGVSNQGRNATIADLMGVRQKPLRLYSQVKYGALARGDADIFMKFPKSTYKEKVWDHAAGVIVVEEAGGKCSDAGGKKLDFSEGRFMESCDRGIVAASETLHSGLIRAVEMSFDSAML